MTDSLARPLTADELLTLIRLELARLTDSVGGLGTLLPNLAPPPITVPERVSVEPADIAQIVQAVSSIRNIDVDELAALIREQVAPHLPEPDPALAEALAKLERQLKRFGEIQAGIARSFGAGGPDQTSYFQQIVGNTSRAIAVSSLNSTTTPLAASATYTGTWEDISNYAQVNVELYARPGTIAGDGSNAQASLYLEFSPDGSNADISIPFLIRDPSLVIPTPLINVGKYFRVRYLNDGGTAAIASLGLSFVDSPDAATTPVDQTALRLQTQLLPQSTKELTRTLDQGIQGSDPVMLVRAVAAGYSPHDGYVNQPVGGRDSNVETTTPLGSGATYTSPWSRSRGYVAIGIGIVADQQSTGNGIVVEFSNDGVNALGIKSVRTFGAAEVANGYASFFVANLGSWYRIKYTNGSTAQGTFKLTARLETAAFQNPVAPLESALSAANSALMVRAVLAGTGPGGYLNVPINASGHLKVDIAAADVSVGIKSLTSWQTGQVTGLSTTTPQALASPALTNRRSIMVIADPTNTKTIFIGHGSGTGACLFPLAAGATVTLEVDETVAIYAYSPGGASQNVMWAEVAGTP